MIAAFVGLQTGQTISEANAMALTRDFKETLLARLQADPAFRDALRKEGIDTMPGATLAQLRQDIQEGLASGPAGELDAEDIKRRGRERLAAMKAR